MPLGPPSVIEGQTRCILFSVFWVSPRCPTLWMSLGKPSVEYAWDAIPNIQNRSKHLSSLPLLNLYQYLCWCLVLFNLFKFDLYCFKSLKGMFKKKIGLTLLYLGKQITLNMEGSSFINKAPQSGRLLTFTKVCLSSLSTFFFNDFQFRRITKYLIKRFKFPQLDTHLCPTCL